MMTPQEREAYAAAMRVVFAMHKYHIAVESACQDWERGFIATPVVAKQLDNYRKMIQESVPIAIDLHDALAEHAS